jgi:hypothetical protein
VLRSDLAQDLLQKAYPGREWIPVAVDDAGKLLGKGFGVGELRCISVIWERDGLSRSLPVRA